MPAAYITVCALVLSRYKQYIECWLMHSFHWEKFGTGVKISIKETENVLVIKEITKLKGWGRHSNEIKSGC